MEIQEGAHAETLDGISQEYRASAKNLLHYGTLRNFDIRKLQKKMKRLGLSRFANAEGNILGSLINAHELIGKLGQNTKTTHPRDHLKIGGGKKLLKNHTKRLFGDQKEKRRVKVMVTLPTLAAHDYNLVLEMVQNGMDCARINCAHDGPSLWKNMVDHVRKASEETGKEVKIAMDLAGLKIRTGALEPGPQVRKFKPERSALGQVVHPAQITLVPDETEILEPYMLPVPKESIARLKGGDIIKLKDTRGKSRKLEVVQVTEEIAVLHAQKTLYVATGMLMYLANSKSAAIPIGHLPRTESFITLFVNDELIVSKKQEMGQFQVRAEDGQLVHPGKISCVPSVIVDKVKEGDPILFDDGKIEGVIDRVEPEQFVVRITRARTNGSKLKSEKGINFPQTDLGLSGLTEKDKKDLGFVAQYADIVNFSFVNTQEDVEELLVEMARLGVQDKVSVVLKIETRWAYRNLIKILLSAMRTKYVGVMIARGDLALEVGWKNMGKVQEEILSICSAAHVPVIWATQVLEGLAKNGLPSRSEITDISSSIRAECVMLNKGPYINEAIALLDEMLGNMEKLHDKKEGMWPKIELL